MNIQYNAYMYTAHSTHMEHCVLLSTQEHNNTLPEGESNQAIAAAVTVCASQRLASEECRAYVHIHDACV